MSKSPSDSDIHRPFSFRPQDFGAPERAAPGGEQAAHGSEREETPFSQREPDTAPKASAGRASTQASRADQVNEFEPKKDQTILMAVPPPAQENKGD